MTYCGLRAFTEKFATRYSIELFLNKMQDVVLLSNNMHTRKVYVSRWLELLSQLLTNENLYAIGAEQFEACTKPPLKVQTPVWLYGNFYHLKTFKVIIFVFGSTLPKNTPKKSSEDTRTFTKRCGASYANVWKTFNLKACAVYIVSATRREKKNLRAKRKSHTR